MVCILLAAGYAQRLYPLTENKPKALLKLGEKTILDMVMEQVETLADIKKVYIVTNHRFYLAFSDWANSYEGNKRVKIVNDFTNSAESRRGAVGDMKYVIDMEEIDDDMLVMACDTVFDFALSDFTDAYKLKNADMICAYRINDAEKAKSLGVVGIDEDGRVAEFEEKPDEPRSDLVSAPFYIYKRETAELIEEYINGGGNTDASGSFVEWLKDKVPVYAYVTDKECMDIADADDYKAAQERYI